MNEELKIAKMVSKANGGVGFYLDLITVEVLGILEEADRVGRKVDGKVIIANAHGVITCPVTVDANGCCYVPLKKAEMDVLQIYPKYIGAFTIKYDKTL